MMKRLVRVLSLCLLVTAAGVAAQQVDVNTLGPQAGQKALDFSLPGHDGKTYSLASAAGPKGTMLVFFRSADWWPYCRTQLVELQRHLNDVKQDGYGLVAISYDSLDTLKGFATQHIITFPLLSDAGSNTITAWGILNKEATGRTAGIPHPGTFIIDRAGTIVSRTFEQPYQERRSATSILEQLSASSPGRTSTVRGAHATLSLKASDAVAALGHRITLSVQITPDARNHVYAPGQKGYIPVNLMLAQDPAFKTYPAKYPSPAPYVFVPLNETVQVYSKAFAITQDVTLALTPEMRARAAKGEVLTIKGELEYQACDDKVCHRPETLPVEWKVTLSPLVAK